MPGKVLPAAAAAAAGYPVATVRGGLILMVGLEARRESHRCTRSYPSPAAVVLGVWPHVGVVPRALTPQPRFAASSAVAFPTLHRLRLPSASSSVDADAGGAAASWLDMIFVRLLALRPSVGGSRTQSAREAHFRRRDGRATSAGVHSRCGA